MNAREAAAEAARRGYWVFPCRRDGDVDRYGKPAAKRPLARDWRHHATCDPGRVLRTWPGPRNNVGIECGLSGLVVVDLDVPDGARQLERVRDGRDLPATLTVRTARGGRHLYFAAPAGRSIRNSASRIAPNVDIRGQGGFVIGPGSVAGGVTYHVTRDVTVAVLPSWLADLADPPRGSAPRTPVVTLPGRGYGPRALDSEMSILTAQQWPGRNDQLNRSAFAMFQLVAAGLLDDETVTCRLWQAAEATGLIADDGPGSVTATIESARRAGLARPRGQVSA